MLRYILIRIFLFIPTLFIVAAVAFFLYRLSPGDPVENLLALRGVSRSGDVIAVNYDREYRKMANELGFDKKPFYFSLLPSYYPDTLHMIINPFEKRRALRLLYQHQNWVEIQKFRQSESEMMSSLSSLRDSVRYKYSEFGRIAEINRQESDLAVLLERKTLMAAEITGQAPPSLRESWINYASSLDKLSAEKKHTILIPALTWNGFDNQFHHWVLNLIRGDFGYSLVDGRKVNQKVFQALTWTASMVLVAIGLSFLISVPIGVYSARFKDSLFDRITSFVLYLIFGIPVFWLATLAVVFLTTPEYGRWTYLFPSVSLNIVGTGGSEWDKIWVNMSKLILPVLCLTLHEIAYLSRQTRSGMLEEINKPYTLAVLAKGLSFNQVLWKHNFPNTLIALTTILFGAIPAALVGSLVIEVIFNIPGMGRLMYQSIFLNDWPVLFSSLILFGVGTMLSYLLGDITYGLVHPEIKYQKS